MQIPEKLKEQLKNLGLDENIYDKRTRKCILSKDRLKLEKVPWYDHAYFIDDNFKNKEDFFIFDPVSLLPCLALNPQPSEKILDMCAAPGTKTFIISFLTNNNAHIVANDISFFRTKRLKNNVNKFNLSAEVTNISGRKIEGSFDKILLDAPCSGEGMINKKEKLFEHWNIKRVKIFSKQQKKLIKHAFDILEVGGTLVYSTCTFESNENEDVVDFLIKKFDNAKLEEINVSINHENGLTEFKGTNFDENMKKCMRIYPNHNNTGGFFVAKITKTS